MLKKQRMRMRQLSEKFADFMDHHETMRIISVDSPIGELIKIFSKSNLKDFIYFISRLLDQSRTPQPDCLQKPDAVERSSAQNYAQQHAAVAVCGDLLELHLFQLGHAGCGSSLLLKFMVFCNHN